MRAPNIAFALLLSLSFFAACGGEDQPEGDLGVEPEDELIDTSSQGLIACEEHSATGYRAGSPFAITTVTADGRPVELHTANAYYLMQQAAARDGVELRVVSGFRTMAEQEYLYGCYIHCNCNSCNLAAHPGYSNHQSGHALDLNTRDSGVYAWLENNAARFGFRRTVPSEIWHWEWWGGGPGGGPCGTHASVIPFMKRVEDALGAYRFDPAGTSDIDGDGLPDACARNSDGVVCFLGSGHGFGRKIDGPNLSDAAGWKARSRHSTIRFADIDGDGKADLCARGANGFTCWRSKGDGFGAAITTDFMTDANGWDDDALYSTIRMADIDGDGRADVCGRRHSGFFCWPSLGDRFGGAIEGPEWSNERGWDDPANYGTIRMGDVDGDGRADVCARSGKSMVCWRSRGDGFGARIDGPDWSDDAGWDDIDNWSTIQLADVDGDGRADLCGRSNKAFRCHLSRGTGFGPAIAGPELSTEKGWGDHDQYSTIRLADVDGDGKLDACGRGANGVRCWRFRGDGFAEMAIGGGLLTDDGAWDTPRYYRSIRFADVDGDGKADLCARGASGFHCWISTGRGFDHRIDGPEWSDARGWNAERYGTTIRLGP